MDMPDASQVADYILEGAGVLLAVIMAQALVAAVRFIAQWTVVVISYDGDWDRYQRNRAGDYED